ncbi:HPr-rel-A system PqqD family peptide chaperone [Thiohalobacter sp.]|uniref:HPr-rel-A system PqqD family peptide chaperone n=1 Tax=Thiohalobacter sp. TaxID=2025948 RepID=UPI0026167C25|nr:HPr-rel-A system PqqD family peptide chaperone [Thiohalobacter sp.]
MTSRPHSALDRFDRWTARDLPLHIYRHDEEWVCFQARSGDTHLFDLLPGTLLELLREGAFSSGELARELRARFDFEEGFDLAEYIDEVLWKFEQHALIRPVT